jgi:hypothetical protein
LYPPEPRLLDLRVRIGIELHDRQIASLGSPRDASRPRRRTLGSAQLDAFDAWGSQGLDCPDGSFLRGIDHVLRGQYVL